MARLKQGAGVEITHGITEDVAGNPLDVSGLRGRVEDDEGYVNEKTGAHMVGVRAEDDCGDGLAYVEEARLRSGRRVSAGYSRRFAANYDQVFRKDARSTRGRKTAKSKNRRRA